MKQTISNACGTVALIHAVGNNLVRGMGGQDALFIQVGHNPPTVSLFVLQDTLSLDSGFLKSFLDSTKSLNPAERAAKLESDDDICGVHDKVAKEGQTAVRTFFIVFFLLLLATGNFYFSTQAPSLEDKVEHHYITFVQKDGHVYELDGRKVGPICHGKVDGSFVKVSSRRKRRRGGERTEGMWAREGGLTPGVG